MSVVHVKQVVITHRHEWNKWPDTDDTDYGPILAERKTWYFRRGDVDLRIETRFYPVYSAYVAAGVRELPITFPWIDNTRPPAESVLAEMRRALGEISADGVTIALWEHTHQCYPSVAEHLPGWFPLRIISFFDDCPGSSDVKTFPVCQWFNALFYGMSVFDFDTGSRTADEYAKRGLHKAYLCPSAMSQGMPEGLVDAGFDLDTKLARMHRGELPIDLLFVGYRAGGQRAKLLGDLVAQRNRFHAAGLMTRLHGIEMPDGVLEPRYPSHPKGMAHPIGPLAIDSLSGLNLPISSLFNCRLLDLWMSGTVQIVFDPWDDLPSQGFVPGEHYLRCDGDVESLFRVLQEMKSHPADAAAMARAAYDKASAWQAVKNWTGVMGDIYFDHLGVAK